MLLTEPVHDGRQQSGVVLQDLVVDVGVDQEMDNAGVAGAGDHTGLQGAGQLDWETSVHQSQGSLVMIFS